MKQITENHIEAFAIEVLQSLGWSYIHGLAIAPEAEFSERESFEQIILTQRLRKVIARINPHIPESAREQAIQKVLRIYSSDLLHNNETFGQYVDIYDVSQAVDDKAVVRIFYESRLAKISLDEEGRRLLEEFDKELEQDEEMTDKQKVKAKWTKLEAVIGNEKRIANLAQDIVFHFEKRQEVIDGKAMIVAMSRRIAADLYNAIIKLRPQWHSDDLTKGAIKVVMTASSDDGPVMQKHHTTKGQRKNLSDRMKDPNDPLKIVIVRDMWLTGFDVPCLHTMYIDKPMRGHTLMQAIARMNRIFGDKPGGLVVDYLGIASDLKKALSFYADAGGKGEPTETQEQAVESMLEKLEIVRQMFFEKSKTTQEILIAEPQAYYGNHVFNYQRFINANAKEKLGIILQAEEHILGLQDGKNRFIREVTLLSQAFALSVPDEEALAVKDEVAIFQAVKARLVKFEGTDTGKSNAQIETAIKQIVDSAVTSDKVIDMMRSKIAQGQILLRVESCLKCLRRLSRNIKPTSSKKRLIQF